MEANLTSHPNLEYFSAPNAKGIKEQLAQIRLPYKILAMYAIEEEHYVWVSLTKPIKKSLKKPPEEKELKPEKDVVKAQDEELKLQNEEPEAQDENVKSQDKEIENG